MPRRVLCKFYAHGACLKGEHCEFSHDWKGPPNNICTYYQKGICTYGSRCRYEHVKASQSRPSASSSSAITQQSLASDSVPLVRSSRTSGPSISRKYAAPSTTLTSSSKTAWIVDPVQQDVSDNSEILKPETAKPEDQPICSYAAAGDCPHGDQCAHIHGDLCLTCGKNCLHPFRPDEREEHLKVCEKKQKQLEALKLSEEIECCVCLERILSKQTPAERKFGLLTECDHPFCISCIRNWRSSSPTTGMDVNSTLRACPICRKLSYFVVPSVIWYSTPEEKIEIIDNYKAKLRSIDCKHFKFGNGNCPFGTSCFYKHTVKPGSYAWKYNRPPPRRPPSRRPRPQGPSRADVDELFSLLGNVISEDEYDDPFGFGFEDIEEDDFSPMDMVMLLMNLDVESDEFPSDDDEFLF